MDYFCGLLTDKRFCLVTQYYIHLPPFPRGCHLITQKVVEACGTLPDAGLMHLLIQHTSAGLTLNENADPSVRSDMDSFLDHLVPENHPLYTHTFEGSDDMPAHLKTSITGASVTIPITRGRLNLGTWQGIYLCEFRNRGGGRRLVVTILS